MPSLDLSAFRALSFDCYGTLIDWERGLLRAFAEVMDARGLVFPDELLLETFSAVEADVEAEATGPNFLKYRDVLCAVLDGVGDELGFAPSPDEQATFAASVASWPPFADSKVALGKLAEHHDLIVLSNVDADLFAGSEKLLGVPFRHVFTADKIGSYKPSPQNFEYLLEHAGVAPGELLHVAQSLFHDIGPARAAGLSTVWVNRRAGQAGGGATPSSEAVPDLEVPDLATLADRIDAARRAWRAARS